MKRLFISGIMLISLAGCGDGMSAREESCLDNGGTWEMCTYEGRQQQREMAKIEAGMVSQSYSDDYSDFDYDNADYPPVERGTQYTNYYGDPRYGSWHGGVYRFSDPYSRYAMQTNSFLLGAGLGGLAGYLGTKAAMRSNWSTANPNGYHSKTYTATKYIDRKGKVISKEEAKRRKAQSKRDRKRHYEKKLAKDRKNLKKAKNKIRKSNKHKKVKPAHKTKRNNKFKNSGKRTKSMYNNKSRKAKRNKTRKTKRSSKRSKRR